MPNNYHTAKEAWIKEQHDKAVQIHHDNIARIRPLKAKIEVALREIVNLQPSIDALNHVMFELRENLFSKKEEKIFARCDHTCYWGIHESNSYGFADNYDPGVDELKNRQKQLALDIAKWQKEIDTNSWDNSCETMQRDSDEEMLAEKYDKLIKATGNQILKEIKNDEEVA
jgi:hypothetical protein